MKTGHSNLPLHGGSCPRWLFEHMKELAGALVDIMLIEFDRREVIRRFSDPYWFQSFGCVLGFDWHSSGLTTTVGGALKEAVNHRSHELGIYVAGGKGAASRKTPHEIADFADDSAPDLDVPSLQEASRMSARVDNNALQDGHQLYHHNFLLSKDGDWSVIQQGMDEESGWARRYHWASDQVDDFVEEPHSAVCSDHEATALNLTDDLSEENRETSAAISRESPAQTLLEFRKITESWSGTDHSLDLPRRHDVPSANHMDRVLADLYEQPPEDFEDLLSRANIGPKTIRALSMVSEVTWGAEPSYEDPVRYSFAHGGKDGHPYPVDRDQYREMVEVLNDCIQSAKLQHTDKKKAFKRLSNLRNN